MSRVLVCRVGVVAAVVSVLVSCGGGSSGSGAGVSGSGSPVSSSSSSEPSFSQSVVSSGPRPSETFAPEQLEAANTVIEYFRIRKAVFSNPDGDPQPLKDITMGQSQEMDMDDLNDYRRQGHVQTGEAVVHITGASEPVEVDGMRMVDVQMCTDVGQVDVIDSATGESVVLPGRSRYLQWNVTVVKTEEGWKFGDATNNRTLGCSA